MELEKTLEKMTQELMDKTGSSVNITIDAWTFNHTAGLDMRYQLYFSPGLDGTATTRDGFKTWPELFRRYRELMATDDIAGLETPNSDNIEEAA